MRPITWQRTALCTQAVKGNHQVFQCGAHLRLRRTAQFRHLQLSTTCSFARRSFLFLAEVWAKLPLAGQSSEMNALGMLLGSSVLMIPTALWMDGLTSFNLMKSTWAALLALSILCTSVHYLLYFKMIKRAGSSNLMLVTLLIPPVAIGLGMTFLGEPLQAKALMGFRLIALGLAVVDGCLRRLLYPRRWYTR